jgi:hypothetical protein
MSVTNPTSLNFIYVFTAGSVTHRFTEASDAQTFDDEVVTPIQISHSAPKFSAEPGDAEIDVAIREDNPLADLFLDGPAPYPIKLIIYEYDRTDDSTTAVYRGWAMRVPFRLTDSLMVLRCKSAWLWYEKESLTDSLSALSRYSVYDPRSGVDIESLRVGITVTALNDERDVLTVTGITEPDDWFKGGMIVAPDRNKRTILKHVTEGADKKLYLNGAFSEFSLASGFSADIYPGDDLTYDTWANKFGSETNNGEAWGGWQYTPNVDPVERGVV